MVWKNWEAKEGAMRYLRYGRITRKSSIPGTISQNHQREANCPGRGSAPEDRDIDGYYLRWEESWLPSLSLALSCFCSASLWPQTAGSNLEIKDHTVPRAEVRSRSGRRQAKVQSRPQEACALHWVGQLRWAAPCRNLRESALKCVMHTYLRFFSCIESNKIH